MQWISDNRLWYKRAVTGLACLLLISLVLPSTAAAYTISTVDVEDRNDFVLEQARTEVVLAPGDTVTEYISVINRTGETKQYALEFETFRGTRGEGPGGALEFIPEGEEYPLSLEKYIEPEVREFELEFREKITIPITISIPEDAEPGGRYGAIIVSNEPSTRAADAAGTGIRPISRLSSLFLVRVAGDAHEAGSLLDFSIKDKEPVYTKQTPLTFNILFENNGNVHLAPHGEVTITNMVGSVIERFDVLPYFVLPDSTRVRPITWDGTLRFGRYTAELALDRGYGDHTDTKEVAFWFVPLKLIAIVFGILFILILLITYIAKNFEFKRKR